MKNLLPLILAAMLLASCAKTVTFNQSTTVPGAHGGVRIKKDKNDNYNVDVHVRNLPNPDDLHPPKRSYVVWLETNDNRSLNIGNVNISRGLFSKKRKGKLETTSSFKPVRIFITPEDEKSPKIPGAEAVLSTSLFRVR
jgi:hypothetical protein